MKHYIYILKCADQSLYVGCTNDLDRRLNQHNNSKFGAHYTKLRRPVKLVYSESFDTLVGARRREKEIKGWRKKKKLALVNYNAKSNDYDALIWYIKYNYEKPQMEKIKSFENKESAERRLIRLLKEKGPEDPETIDLLDVWTREQEERVEKTNEPEGGIELNLKRARLYFEAGYIDEAFENFEAARMQAWNENRMELYKEIVAEMDRMESN